MNGVLGTTLPSLLISIIGRYIIGSAVAKLTYIATAVAENRSATMRDNPVAVLFTGFNSSDVSHYTI